MSTTLQRRLGTSQGTRTQTRVGIYTRKSHAQGLEQEFNSIDAQRQAVESFVASQKGAGWIALPERYDDGGYSGATTDRPAFQRLLADIAAKKVDCIAVYRIDRLSRSFADYVGILKLLEQHGVTFVSVTEQFNTTTPTGRLVLNQLILFAQFEREVIAERVRDKVRSTRRRGAWTGGRPVLGFDVIEKKLVVNNDEANRVREIFGLYIGLGSLRAVVAELRRRGWSNKAFVSKSGRQIPGSSFTKPSVHGLLTNIVYRGLIRCGEEEVPGVHEPVVDAESWTLVQQRLQDNGKAGGAVTRNTTGATLRGLLYCGRCNSPMLHTFSNKQRQRFRYYLCSRAHNEGVASCPKTRVAAGRFEQFIVDQIRVIGTDEVLLAKTAAAVAKVAADRREQIANERRRLEQQRRRTPEQDDVGRVLELEHRRLEIQQEAEALGDGTVDIDKLRSALAAFQPIWDRLFPAEQERVLRLLLERVTYDPDTGDVDLDLRPAGIESLANEATESA